MNVQDYLDRIRYSGSRLTTLEALAGLQKAHLLTVPFENLDIHRGKEIVLELPRFFAKIVGMRRGGFCYELNGLFHWLLLEFGFESRMLSGRVYDRATGGFGQEFDHLLLMVRTSGREWLVDVGFGEFSLAPLEFVPDRTLHDPCGEFLIEPDTDGSFRVSRFSTEDGGFRPQYRFSTLPAQLADFAGMCRYHQTSPRSSFTRSKLCSIATAGGRVTLTDDRLIVTEQGQRTELPVRGEEEFTQALSRYFDIRLDSHTGAGSRS